MEQDETQAEPGEFDEEVEANPDGMLIGYVLGPPAAFSGDCVLQERNANVAGSGCTAVIRCDCGQQFRLNLLQQTCSYCPKCNAEFTSLLVIAQSEDDEILQSVFEHLVGANGQRNPGALEADAGGEGDLEADAGGDLEPDE